MAASHPLQRGRCTRGEGAPRPQQAPPVNRPHAPAVLAADRRRTGGAKDGANGAAPSEAGLAKAGARTRAGGFPPPPSPPRRTDPLAADRAALDAHGRPATPTARESPGGARQRQQMVGRRPTGWGGGGWRSGPPSPPLAPPPSLRATGATLRPPRAEGTPPLPQKRPRREGGGCGWTCTPRAPAPPAACSREGRSRQASPYQRAGAAHRPSLGAAHGGAPEQYWGRASHDPPHDHCPPGEGRGRVQV